MIELAGDLYIDYKITLTGYISNPTSAPANADQSASTTFILRVKNPCLDPKYVKIVPNDLFYMTYTLGSFAPSGMEFEHNRFTVETYPVQHDLCGEITYEAFFNGQPVAGTTLNTSPLQYDPSTGVFTFFTDSPNLIGTHEYTVRAYLTKYQNTATFGSDITASATNNIVVKDACTGLESVTANQNDEERVYYYGESLTFKLNAFIVLPQTIACSVAYSCEVVEGPKQVNLCNSVNL